MSTTASLDTFSETEAMQSAREFRVVIVYETPAIGSAAMKLCERLMEKFNDSYLFRFAVQSFDKLEEETHFQQSLKAAESAEMIFIGSAGALPAKFVEWFKRCVEHRREDVPVALVDMTSDTSARAEEIHELLRSAAKAYHLDLISKEQCARPVMTATVSSAPRSHSADIRHWGINE